MSGNPPQQPPQCEECGQQKLPEEISLTDSSGRQISAKTGWSTKLILNTPLESLGLGGLSSENEMTLEGTETKSMNDTFTEKKTFLLCPNEECKEHINDVINVVGWKHRVHPTKKYSPNSVREEAKARLKMEQEINDIEIDLSSEDREKSVTSKSGSPANDSATHTIDEQTNTVIDKSESHDGTASSADGQTATGFSDRVRQWWTGNRVRQWVTGRSDNDTQTATTENTDSDAADLQSTQNHSETDEQQTSLWEYSTEAQAALSQGEVGQESNDDYRDINTGMGSSTSESEDFDNDRSNSL
jgi:hypothetical protein